MNTRDLEPVLDQAGRRVLETQAKLHRWATGDLHHRFSDLFNLVADLAFVLVAWDRVRSNKGPRTAGVDGKTARCIETAAGAEGFPGQVRCQLRQRSFRPVPVREPVIPQADGKMRRLGIPATTGRVVQAALELVLEPVSEADFHPCSYRFRPGTPGAGRDRRDTLSGQPLLGVGGGG